MMALLAVGRSAPAQQSAADFPTVTLPAANWEQPPSPDLPAWPTDPVAPAESADQRLGERLTESSWSARIDYFHWNERVDGEDFVNEDGPLVALSYLRRIGPERFRAELFGGSVGYGADIDYFDGSSEYLSSHTNYLGLRGEYDFVFEPAWLPVANVVAGLGTRFWFRDLPDSTTPSGTEIWGYRETWWTIYPYLGLETRGVPDLRNIEFFGSARLGSTAITYEHVTWNDVSLYPELGVTGQLELGLRSRRLFLSAHTEFMTWGESDLVRDSCQPRSRLVTVGLRTGFRF